jgi:hypothetical protein
VLHDVGDAHVAVHEAELTVRDVQSRQHLATESPTVVSSGVEPMLRVASMRRTRHGAGTTLTSCLLDWPYADEMLLSVCLILRSKLQLPQMPIKTAASMTYRPARLAAIGAQEVAHLSKHFQCVLCVRP